VNTNFSVASINRILKRPESGHLYCQIIGGPKVRIRAARRFDGKLHIKTWDGKWYAVGGADEITCEEVHIACARI
jgi:hypothetical protein